MNGVGLIIVEGEGACSTGLAKFTYKHGLTISCLVALRMLEICRKLKKKLEPKEIKLGRPHMLLNRFSATSICLQHGFRHSRKKETTKTYRHDTTMHLTLVNCCLELESLGNSQTCQKLSSKIQENKQTVAKV